MNSKYANKRSYKDYGNSSFYTAEIPPLPAQWITNPRRRAKGHQVQIDAVETKDQGSGTSSWCRRCWNRPRGHMDLHVISTSNGLPSVSRGFVGSKFQICIRCIQLFFTTQTRTSRADLVQSWNHFFFSFFFSPQLRLVYHGCSVHQWNLARWTCVVHSWSSD